NSAVKVIGIAQIKDPKTMVEKNEYEKAYNSIGRLKGFIRKYPDSVYASQARSRIKQLSNSQ
ncbi:MAG: outer membrane protein assembly factor BamD, partial [Sulfurimonadaceae bacterium]|nr:outer membrane protein assembly factor BamD [Sulfurimonadaceae bacterium]